MLLRGKRVTVIGLARSGVGAANLLSELGASVTVTDIRDERVLAEQIKMLAPSVKLAVGGHPDAVFSSADILVISPGVPLGIGPVIRAKAAGVPVMGELELAYRIMSEEPGVRSQESEVKTDSQHRSVSFLAITGSNGKSTTTTLLDLMMRKAGFRTTLGGNIGNALTEEILRMSSEQLAMSNEEKTESLSPVVHRSSPDFVVAEVSSFQLEAIEKFRPRIAAILNITPDHMDRYHSLSEYAEAKARIFENQTGEDFLVLNADDPRTLEIEKEKLKRENGPAVVYFSRMKKVKGLYSYGKEVFCDLSHLKAVDPGRPLIGTEKIAIKGVHNLENAMAAAAMALLAGCPAGAVIESLKEFQGLEHRLEFVRELDGVRYINDSKGTNVGAVVKSIESFREPLILIAGGRDKAGDFSELRDLVSRKVKSLVLIGEAAKKIHDALGDITETVTAGNLRDAVAVSRSMAQRGDVVLLSPACASFDMFRDFEDRGRQFKKIVMELAENE
jgi:UDP-N-acetylmuramoylalanine--D-glutamate ligase